MRSVIASVAVALLVLAAGSASAAESRVMLRVCNRTGAANPYVCSGNCTYYSVPPSGCVTDPTDPWMSLGLTCQPNARCANITEFDGPGCPSTTPTMTNPAVPCGTCNDDGGVMCTPDAVTWLWNCSSPTTGGTNCLTGCNVQVQATQGKCVSFTEPSQGGKRISVLVNGFESCSLIRAQSFHGGENNCSASAAESQARWVANGACARVNIDNEGTFSYAYECSNWAPSMGTATPKPFKALPASIRAAIARDMRRRGENSK